jgi:nitroreductase
MSQLTSESKDVTGADVVLSRRPTGRKTDHPISSIFTERWSPRAFTGEAIPDEILFSVFEAARWAPSGSNAQPWRFIFSRRDSSSWETFLNFLNPNNRLWAEKASALVLIVSKKTVTRNSQEVPSKSHSFDAGAAWQNLSLQAFLLGWHTHGMGGFDQVKAREAIKVPDDFAIEAVIAIGKQADKATLPSELQEREIPNTRHPLKDLVWEGSFSSAEGKS